MTLESTVNHVWQSSWFALFAGALALMLRSNSPRVRYWIWMSASLKFLLPWSVLIGLGSAIPWQARPAVPAPFTGTLLRVALRAATPGSLPIPVPTLITPAGHEPGVVGFIKPVIV